MPLNTSFHFRHALLALTLSVSAAPALAQPASALGNWRDYEKAGYVAMNGMTTPLLHYARTGQMFDALQLADDAVPELPDELRWPRRGAMNRLVERYTAMVADGVADGSLRRVDPVIAGHALSGLLNALAEVQHWVAPGPGPAPAPLASIFARPLLCGGLAAGA